MLIELKFSPQIFEKSSNIKIHENPASRSQVVPCGQTDMMKLTVAFRKFANVPKNRKNSHLKNWCFTMGRCTVLWTAQQPYEPRGNEVYTYWVLFGGVTG
jgi:hypothetical protein